MAGIFISYRRSESRHAAGRLADDLAQAFGARAIFRDIEGIDPGVDFSKALEKALASCNVMLVLMGPQWLDVADAQGRRRLAQPGDWIRQEIATALKRDIRVIPVLLEGAELPEAADLPDDLQALVRRQALELADGRWKGDVQRLIETLQRVPGLTLVRPDPPPSPPPGPVPAPAPAPSRKGLWTGAVLGAGGLVVLSLLLAEGQPVPGPAVVPAAGEATPAPVAAEDEGRQGSSRAGKSAAQGDSGVSAIGGQGGAAAPSPAPALPSPDVPDFSGLWRTLNGEAYDFEQNGAQVRFTALMNGQPIGRGQGRYANGMLRLTMSAQTPNGRFTVNCDMQATLGEEHWAGMCMGPNGPFAAQMFR